MIRIRLPSHFKVRKEWVIGLIWSVVLWINPAALPVITVAVIAVMAGLFAMAVVEEGVGWLGILGSAAYRLGRSSIICSTCDGDKYVGDGYLIPYAACPACGLMQGVAS